MRIKFKDSCRHFIILEASFVSYKKENLYVNDVEETTLGSGLFIKDITGTDWVVPRIGNTECNFITDRLLRDGYYDLTSSKYSCIGYREVSE